MGLNCCRQATDSIASEVTSAFTQALQPIAHQNQPLEVDSPDMQKFFQEIAELKPVRFTMHHLHAFTHGFSLLIGTGGFGKVYKGNFPNGVHIAVKILSNEATNVEQSFMAEVRTIARTHHINLVRLYGYCYDPLMKALVYEFLEKGSLDKYLFDEDSGTLPWPKLLEIAVGTAKGLAYLHEECQQRIIHYDIKPGNILLDSNFCPKVADFGLANLSNRDRSSAGTVGFRGTPGYLAPEFIMMNFPITYKCDVYSFGILLFEIVGRRKNFISGVSDSSEKVNWFPSIVWEKYETGDLSALIDSSGIANEFTAEIERAAMVALWCVQWSPEARPSMSTVLKMLEGGREISPPPNPFHYLTGMGHLRPQLISSSGGDNIISLKDYW